MANKNTENARKKLFAPTEQIENEIKERVNTFLKFVEITEEIEKPLTPRETQIAEMGAVLGARALQELMRQSQIVILKREELELITNYLTHKLKDKLRKKLHPNENTETENENPE